MHYVWKEALEQTRGRGLWLGLGLVTLISLFLVAEARGYPSDLGFEALLMGLFDMNVYLLPLLAMFLSSFSVYQERELKTLLILLTRRESNFSFLYRKSLALQLIIILAFVSLYLLLALPMKFSLLFRPDSFLAFLLILAAFLLIFVQIGVFLGSVCRNKMQLIGANIVTWFVLVFLLDLAYMYFLPLVDYGNVQIFSWLYFLNPLHALRMTLENQLGLFTMTGLSRMMQGLVFLPPVAFTVINVVLWPLVFFGLALAARQGAQHD
ncbi:ABC transporter permease subunit [Deinococcus sp. MIMF12]|uniref:ABC transporter permease subunit n=1 Tax=Deinococcus rhizophilus TaxID=3049544 RepID=A0ABT7JEY5_9DEIO|nr:ABC transporter permease subunit [Deinococcus rhizophilus]MDL2343038.1 ABC transporter permease subunit [Deinococcus rhizophilus]